MTLRGMIPGANALKPTGRLWVLVRRQNEHETTTLPDRNTLALGQALELCDEMGRYAPGYSVTRRGTVSSPFGKLIVYLRWKRCNQRAAASTQIHDQ